MKHYTKTTGYVGSDLVIEYSYPGKDSGLSHYSFKGKTYVGIVKFNSVVSKKPIAY